MFNERVEGQSAAQAAHARACGLNDQLDPHGFYEVQCFDKDGNLKWEDTIHNVVCTEGKNAAFTQLFKTGISGTPPLYMGLINNVTYSAPVVGNTAGAIANSGSANSWNEAVVGTCAARQVPAFAAASAGAISLSAARTFTIVGTDTINGVFLLITSVAAVAPTATVAATAGSIWSAGAFTGGAKAVANGDTLNVSYTASM